MPYNPKYFVDLLIDSGYIHVDQLDHFDYTVPYLFYLYRVNKHYHEYISIVTYDGGFCEAIQELFLSPKKTKARPKGKDSQRKGDPYTEFQRKGFAPAHTAIARTPEDFALFVSTPYIVKGIV